jgi:hypothetical protein
VAILVVVVGDDDLATIGGRRIVLVLAMPNLPAVVQCAPEMVAGRLLPETSAAVVPLPSLKP